MSGTKEPTRLPTCGDSGGRTVDGSPCQTAFGLCPTSGLCVFHDPERREVARVGRLVGARRGAEASRVRKILRDSAAPKDLPRVPLDSMEGIAAWLRWIAKAVAIGTISPAVARETTQACKELRGVLATLGLEARVKELEKALARAQREGRRD